MKLNLFSPYTPHLTTEPSTRERSASSRHNPVTLKRLGAAALLLGVPGACAWGPHSFDGSGQAQGLTGLMGSQARDFNDSFGPYGMQVWDAIQICGPFNMLPSAVTWPDAQLLQMRVVSGLRTPLSIGPLDHAQASCVVDAAQRAEQQIRTSIAAASARAQEGKDAADFAVFVIMAAAGVIVATGYASYALISCGIGVWRRRQAEALAPDVEMQNLAPDAASVHSAQTLFSLHDAADGSDSAKRSQDSDDESDLERQAQAGKHVSDGRGQYAAAALVEHG